VPASTLARIAATPAALAATFATPAGRAVPTGRLVLMTRLAGEVTRVAAMPSGGLATPGKTRPTALTVGAAPSNRVIVRVAVAPTGKAGTVSTVTTRRATTAPPGRVATRQAVAPPSGLAAREAFAPPGGVAAVAAGRLAEAGAITAVPAGRVAARIG
jgi:hypothetical protein